ncbi:MAG TPA: acetyl-CoA acetyltransferase [Gammaproteobacteria bacterium]|nr:acetyl-CoA acetyltransferase [Gammaproteobacteria bacterium]
MSLKGSAAIVGIAEMAPQKKPEGKTSLGIIAQMAREAIADAGLEKGQIDGLLTAASLSDFSMLWPSAVVEYLHLKPRYFDQVELGGASSAAMVWRAAAAIEAGMCETVLCVIGDTWDSRLFMENPPPFPATEAEFDAPYGLAGANPGYALIAQRHMHEFGTKAEQLAKVAVDQRTNACANPLALFGDKPITIDDVLSSRMIAEPLHLLEIVSPATGGGAFIVTRADLARRGRNRPVYLLGAGEAGEHSSVTRAPSITHSLVKPASERAFRMAGITPDQVDFVQPYDCYTITVLVTLEDAGFCKKGEGGPFVAEHDLTWRGDLPCNTHGGQLSFGQPGIAGGMSHVIEGVRQLMGRGGERQIADASLGYVNGNGGIMAEQCSLILGLEP